MKDFIMAALPFVILGICVIVIIINRKDSKKTYISEGMCLGMSFGVMISSMFSNNYGLGISLGMFVGEAIGSLILKK